MNDFERIAVFAKFARDLSTLSKCEEGKVAAIVVNESLTQVLSIGINGGPKGLANCLCVIDGKYGCIHAEINALIKCNSAEPRKIMIVTLQPCKQCAAAIINAPGGFSTVYYLKKWKDDAGLKLLRAAGITAVHLEV